MMMLTYDLDTCCRPVTAVSHACGLHIPLCKPCYSVTTMIEQFLHDIADRRGPVGSRFRR